MLYQLSYAGEGYDLEPETRIELATNSFEDCSLREYKGQIRPWRCILTINADWAFTPVPKRFLNGGTAGAIVFPDLAGFLAAVNPMISGATPELAGPWRPPSIIHYGFGGKFFNNFAMPFARFFRFFCSLLLGSRVLVAVPCQICCFLAAS
jgi:hypothetical protein